MPILDIEVRNIQNPAFGAVILATFVQGFYNADETKEGVPLPYLFLVLPIVLHSDIYRLLSGTRPSLRHMAEKFVSAEYAGTDLLLSLNSSARRLRGLTAESLGVLFLTGFAKMDSKKGRIIPRKVRQFSRRPDMPSEAEESRKLGKWFSQLSAFEIGSILKVTF
jgi:ABC-3C biological conflict system middle component